MAELIIRRESWPIAGTFTISRGAKTTADVVVVELEDGDVRGRGECVPYPRYDETVDGVVATIESLRRPLVDGLDRASLQNLLPAGAARNAVDCALWDLEARHKGMAVWQLAGLTHPEPVETAFTLSLDTAPNMAAAARRHRHHSLLKIKLSGRGDLERVAAVRENAPDSRLILDANESWSAQMVEPHSNALARMDISLLEQPLPAADDDLLAEVEHGVPICADESCHTTADLPLLVGKYDAVNIKLDKTGGLTEALQVMNGARAVGLQVMVGCMLATSLAMAPALLLAQEADFVDLDGALLLARDRDPGLRFEDGLLHPASPQLWG